MDYLAQRKLRENIRTLLEPTVSAEGLELVAVEIVGSRRGTVLRLFVDKDGGPTISDCQRVNHAVSPELDVEDPMGGAYILEVSSPGIDRIVERAKDFERFVGYRAKIRMAPGTGRKRYTGDIVSHGDSQLVVEVDGATHTLSMDEVDRVRLDLTLEQYNELGAPSLDNTGE